MRFTAVDANGKALGRWEVFSVGGGALRDEGSLPIPRQVYDLNKMYEKLDQCKLTGQPLWEYVEEREGKQIWEHLRKVWDVMQAAIERGLHAEGVLPGGLGLARKSWSFYRKTMLSGQVLQRAGLVSAYALAVSEENACGGEIVTAPTCGSCGIVPAVLRYLQEVLKCSDDSILGALATAGLIGNLAKHNASISGAEVGCQGEVGVACAMAAGAAAQLLGGTPRQIEYAAEMGLEHNLGLTCDPEAGLSGWCTTWATIHCDFFEGKYALVLTQSGDVTSDFITVDWGGNRTINDDGRVSIDFGLAYYSRPFAEGFDQGLFDEFPIAQSMLRVPANHCEYIAVRPEVSCAFEEEFFFPFGLTSGIGIVDLAPIPLPATPALLGTALLGLTWIRRRR